MNNDKNNTLLLVDFNNTIIRSLKAMLTLSYNNVPTGGIYGFISQLCSVINAVKPSHILVCDDKKPYFRSELFPEYKQRPAPVSTTKATGEGEEDDFYSVLKINKDVITNVCENGLGVVVWAVPGCEADDLIGGAVVLLHKQFEKIVILSNDDDLYQLFTFDNVFLWKKKVGLYGRIEFINEFGIEPDSWLLVTALAGTHNAVPGIPRVGIKTAIKIVNEPFIPKHRKILSENRQLVERNKRLIKIPFEKCTITTVDDLPEGTRHEPKAELGVIKLIIDEWGINITQTMHDAFGLYQPRRKVWQDYRH